MQYKFCSGKPTHSVIKIISRDAIKLGAMVIGAIEM